MSRVHSTGFAENLICHGVEYVLYPAVFAVTVIGLPVAIWMLNRLPYVVSLYRY